MSRQRRKLTNRPEHFAEPQRTASILDAVADVTATQPETVDAADATQRPAALDDTQESETSRRVVRAVEAPDALFAPHWPTLRRDAIRTQRPRPPRITPMVVSRVLPELPWTASPASRSSHVQSGRVPSASDTAISAELRRIRHIAMLGLLTLALTATVLIGAVVFDSVAAVTATLPR